MLHAREESSMKCNPLNIGTTKQLFFDNYIIEMVTAMTRRMHQPVKWSQNPLIKQDRPWEVTPYFRTGTMCVTYDPHEEHFKCWYCDYAWDYEAYIGRKQFPSGLVVPGFQFETTDNRWLYAESEDGREWHKPELDYLAIDGRKTNICLGGGDHGQVYVGSFFLDTLEQDPDKRFKAIYWRQRGKHVSATESQIVMAHSADGRRWRSEEKPLTVGNNKERRLGDEIMILPDSVIGQYIMTVREMAMCGRLSFKNIGCEIDSDWGSPYYPDNPLLMNKRRVFVTNSTSLEQWPTLREMLVPDDREDNLDEAFYSFPIVRMGEYLVGFLNVFHVTDNTMNVQLLFSHDGFNWQRAERGRTFLDTGSKEEGAWDPYLVEIGNTVIIRDDAIYLYYGGSACHHDWWMFGEKEGLDMPDEPGVCKTAMGLATLRPDGFVSVDSTVRPAVFMTRPFISSGTQLTVNVRCGEKGYFEAELADASDRVIEGYERKSSHVFHGDDTNHAITWKERRSLPEEILRKGAKLRFFSRDCSIYSFAVVNKL